MSNRFNFVSLLCYDNDSVGGGDGTGDTAAATATAAAAAAAAKNDTQNASRDEKTFTQEQVNEFLAKDKRKHQEKIAQLEGSYQQLLQNQSLTKEERDSLQKQLEDLQAANRTKEQQAEFERKQAENKYKNELKTAKARAEHWESLFKKETVHRSLHDAAHSAEAFNPSHIVALLEPDTELKEEDGTLKPYVRFKDIDEKTGEPCVTLRTPEDAVKRMKELPKIHGCLFKSNVVAGVGSGQATIGTGAIDYAGMSTEEYMKRRKDVKEQLNKR